MGNCCRIQTARPKKFSENYNDETWEWADPESTHRRHYTAGADAMEDQADQLLKGEDVAAQLSTAATEVRIKISKKKLQALLQNVEAQGLPLQLLLARLMSDDGGALIDDRGRGWRPVLHSIPEAAE